MVARRAEHQGDECASVTHDSTAGADGGGGGLVVRLGAEGCGTASAPASMPTSASFSPSSPEAWLGCDLALFEPVRQSYGLRVPEEPSAPATRPKQLQKLGTKEAVSVLQEFLTTPLARRPAPQAARPAGPWADRHIGGAVGHRCVHEVGRAAADQPGAVCFRAIRPCDRALRAGEHSVGWVCERTPRTTLMWSSGGDGSGRPGCGSPTGSRTAP